MATITENKALYTAKTHTTGGRSGQSRSSKDGSMQLSVPGSTGQGTNPEQLFAAGPYSKATRGNIPVSFNLV